MGQSLTSKIAISSALRTQPRPRIKAEKGSGEDIAIPVGRTVIIGPIRNPP
jgi:hypothetical protein